MINEAPVEMIFVDTNKGILKSDEVSVFEMARHLKQVLKKRFQAEFPISRKEVMFCGADVIFELLQKYPELAVGIEDKVAELSADLLDTSYFCGS